MDYRVDKDALAAVFGCHRNMVTKFVGEGMPVEQKGSKGTPWVFDLRACVQWWGQRGREPGEDLDVTQERARLAYEQANAQALKNAELRGELLRGEVVEAWLVRLLGAMTQRIRSIAPKAAPEVRATASDAEGEALIAQFHDEALQEIADALRASPGVLAGIRPAPTGASGGDSGIGGDAAAEADGERVGGRRAKAEPGEQRGAGAVENEPG